MADGAPELVWERLGPHVMRCRLPFCDVTVGVVHGAGDAVVVDTGTTRREARAIARDVAALTGATVGHVLLTHHHFDHILGSSVFEGARTYCSPEVVAAIAGQRHLLRADALRHGADVHEVDDALAALAVPVGATTEATVTLGEVAVSITHAGRGHTGHDLIAVVTAGEHTVVFCGDLVEESGDPCVDADSDLAAWPATLDRVLEMGGPSAVYVPGHGAVVDAAFVRRQADWLRARPDVG